MKTLTNLKKLTVLTAALFALSAPVLAQTEPLVDLELTSVDVITAQKSNSFQLITNVTMYDYGQVASHAVDVVMEYGPLVPILIHDFVDYWQDENNCKQQSILNCANGTCTPIAIYGVGSVDRFCTSAGTWTHLCGCANVIQREFGWVDIIPGFTTVTITVDPDNLVEEIDETNNTIVVDLQPIANEAESWSAIKSMYR